MIKCPNCGKSYYMEKYTTCTAMYYPPVYKDGVNINPDRNISTTVCVCLECQNVFSYQKRGEELICEASVSN